jgi:hypothetical protein
MAGVPKGPVGGQHGLRKATGKCGLPAKTSSYPASGGALELFFKLGFHLSEIGSMLALFW